MLYLCHWKSNLYTDSRRLQQFKPQSTIHLEIPLKGDLLQSTFQDTLASPQLKKRFEKYGKSCVVRNTLHKKLQPLLDEIVIHVLLSYAWSQYILITNYPEDKKQCQKIQCIHLYKSCYDLLFKCQKGLRCQSS